MSPEALQYSHIRANPPYVLSESMTSYSTEANLDRIKTSEPGESDHDDLLLQKLGEKGWGRLHYFRKEFSTSWGEGEEGRPLSPKSQEAFFDFLNVVSTLKTQKPSLFLTDEGHLEICWEDASGKSVQFEFGPHETEVYLEESNTELIFPNAELRGRLAQFGLVE